MRDYKRVSVYHLLDQLVGDIYDLTRTLPAGDRAVVGVPMVQAATRATTAVIHGCLSKNAATLLPYIEEAHALTEEIGQHLRVLQRHNLADERTLELLAQRHQSCNKLLLQWRHTLLLAGVDDEEPSWLVNDADPELPKRKLRRPHPPKYPGR